FVELRADEVREEAVLLEALPPPTGDLTVTANVAEAVVSLDGEPLGLAPFVLPDLSVGTHRLTLEAPERQPWTEDVEVRADERTWLTVELAHVPEGRSPMTWALGGVSVAALGGSVALGVVARRRADEFHARWNEPGRGSVEALREETRR